GPAHPRTEAFRTLRTLRRLTYLMKLITKALVVNQMQSVVPLGDQAALAYFADEMSALAFASAVRQTTVPWVVDVVQAYASVAVFYDLDRINFNAVAERLKQIAVEPGQ